MEVVKRYTIPYKGLKNGVHDFEFEVNTSLFEHFNYQDIKECKCLAKVEVDRSETMLKLYVEIEGEVVVECDRCLEDCNLEVDYADELLVKFSSTEDEFDGEVMWLSPAEDFVDLGLYIYESILLSLPYNRVHEDGECDPKMMEQFQQISAEEFEKIQEQAEQDQQADDPEKNRWKDQLAAIKEKMTEE